MLVQALSGSRGRVGKALRFIRKRKVIDLLKEGLIILIRVYQQTFSLLLGPCCRYTPSCSSYAVLSIKRFGILEGSCLALKRFLKCHPFHPGGYDPVPEITKNTSKEIQG